MNPRLGASPSRSRSLCVLLPDQPVRAAPHFRWQTANLPTTAAKALLGATPVHDAAVCGRSRYPRRTPIHHAQTRVRFEPKRRTLRAHQLLRAHLKEGVVSSRSNLRAQQQAHHSWHRNKKRRNVFERPPRQELHHSPAGHAKATHKCMEFNASLLTEAQGKADGGRARNKATQSDAPSVRLHSAVKHGKAESVAAKHTSQMHAGCSASSSRRMVVGLAGCAGSGRLGRLAGASAWGFTGWEPAGNDL